MANMTMVVVMSQMVFNRKKLDVCVYLMSAVAVQMEVNREDKCFLEERSQCLALAGGGRCKCNSDRPGKFLNQKEDNL